MTTLKATMEEGKNLTDLPPGSPELESTYQDPDITTLLKEIEGEETLTHVIGRKGRKNLPVKKRG